MIFAGHVALLFQTRPHAPSVSGFQGNWRPPACSAELCSLVKAGQTPLLSCQWVTMDSPQQDSTVSPALLLQFQALSLITLLRECQRQVTTWLYCPLLKSTQRRGSAQIQLHWNIHRWGSPASAQSCWAIIVYYLFSSFRVPLCWNNNKVVVKHKAMINDGKTNKTSHGWNLKQMDFNCFSIVLYFNFTIFPCCPRQRIGLFHYWLLH